MTFKKPEKSVIIEELLNLFLIFGHKLVEIVYWRVLAAAETPPIEKFRLSRSF